MKQYKRNIKCEYFEVVCRNILDNPNQSDRLFDLSLFIEKADGLSFEDRKLSYYQEYARLDFIEYDRQNDLWFLSFVRLRENNIPNIATETQVSKPIELANDEYIGEDTYILYDETLHIIMLQRNGHGLSPTGIEDYLNRVWKSNTEMIYLRAICPVELQSKLYASNQYRKINISLANMKENSKMINLCNKTLGRLIDALSGFNGNRASFEVSIGMAKNDELDKNEVREVIKDVYSNSSMISGASITLRDTEGNVDIIDLFDKKLQDTLIIYLDKKESVSSNEMMRVMIDQYCKSKNKIKESIDR